MEKKFSKHSTIDGNAKWEQSISRSGTIKVRKDDIRTEFWRDYNRLLHSNAYRRLKHKTQVFHSTSNDHICTRIEHVSHVASVSYTICDYLGLNTELALAIALGHDIGHAPFGHDGEHILSDLAKNSYGGNFWHEKNSLHFADSIELLQNSEGIYSNLSLTYAVRDGLISHCGEVDEKSIFPRNEIIDLQNISRPNEHSPFTWEAAVVKIADKISYLGRDIEDALALNILEKNQLEELSEILTTINSEPFKVINNTVLIHRFVIDLCNNSYPTDGLCFSEPYRLAINKIKHFNYKHIYLHPRLNNYEKYCKLIIESLFNALSINNTVIDPHSFIENQSKFYPSLIMHFKNWLIKYSNYAPNLRSTNNYQNVIIYDIHKKRDYNKAIIDFLSAMTDKFALEMYNELIRF